MGEEVEVEEVDEEEEDEEEESCSMHTTPCQEGTGAGASGVNTGVNVGSVVKEGGGGGGVHLEVNVGSAVKEGAGARGSGVQVHIGADAPTSLAGAGGSVVKGDKGVGAREVLGGCTGEFVGSSGEIHRRWKHDGASVSYYLVAFAVCQVSSSSLRRRESGARLTKTRTSRLEISRNTRCASLSGTTLIPRDARARGYINRCFWGC